MVFRLHRAGNDAKVILDGVRQTHHAVRLELAEVDDGVRLVEIRGVGEFLRADGVREGGVRLRKVLIQLRTDSLACVHAAQIVNMVHMRRGIEPAGAVSEQDACAARAEHLRQLAQKRRMRGCRLLGLHGRDQIDLYDDAHAVFDPVEPAERGKRLCKRSPAFLRVIAFAGNNRYIDSHIQFLRSLRQLTSASALVN